MIGVCDNSVRQAICLLTSLSTRCVLKRAGGCPASPWHWRSRPDTGGWVLRRITKCLGVLASAGLAAASIGSASAATTPNVTTKAQWQVAISHVPQRGSGCFRASYPALAWHAAKCVAAPRIPVVPAVPSGSARHAGPETLGDGVDYSAQVTGLISA